MLRICCGGSCRLLMLPKVMFQRLGLDQGEGAKALLAQQDAQVCMPKNLLILPVAFQKSPVKSETDRETETEERKIGSEGEEGLGEGAREREKGGGGGGGEGERERERERD